MDEDMTMKIKNLVQLSRVGKFCPPFILNRCVGKQVAHPTTTHIPSPISKRSLDVMKSRVIKSMPLILLKLHQGYSLSHSLPN
jgi:hypothetical protein